MAVRPAGAMVQLTDQGPIDGGPEPGDVLETRTGRRYLIVERRPLGRRGFSYGCLVMAPEDPYPEGSVLFCWAWAPRAKRRAG